MPFGRCRNFLRRKYYCMKRKTHVYGSGGGSHGQETVTIKKPKHAGPVRPVKDPEASDAGCLVGIIIAVISLTYLLI